MSDPSPSADHFRQSYAQQPPWEIGQLQPALAAVADRIQGSVLDAGCGTGDCAMYFAARGRAVYGVDFVPEAIARAKAKAELQGLEVCFLTMDALALGQLPRQFDNVIDSGLFHVLSDSDRTKYVAALATILRPGGHLWLLCFSEHEPPGPGPRRTSRQDLETTFADDWQIESIDDVHMQAATHVPAGVFSPGGPRAYRLVARRDGTARDSSV
jgi:cyclopropane fatty-acyl-phospholipid synthase-like methyltransferase